MIVRLRAMGIAGFLALVAGPVWAAGSGVTALREFYRSAPIIEGRFEQQQFDDQAQPLSQSKGDFLIARPLRFRWDYQSPQKQTLVSDGREFRLYDADLAQVTVRPLDDALRGAPLRLLMEGDALEQEFVLENEGPQDGLLWVRLLPRSKQSDFTRVRIGLAEGLPRRLELSDQLGQTTRIRLEELRRPAKVDDSRFTLKLPSNVEIVGGDLPGRSSAKP